MSNIHLNPRKIPLNLLNVISALRKSSRHSIEVNIDNLTRYLQKFLCWYQSNGNCAILRAYSDQAQDTSICGRQPPQSKNSADKWKKQTLALIMIFQVMKTTLKKKQNKRPDELSRCHLNHPLAKAKAVSIICINVTKKLIGRNPWSKHTEPVCQIDGTTILLLLGSREGWRAA